MSGRRSVGAGRSIAGVHGELHGEVNSLHGCHPAGARADAPRDSRLESAGFWPLLVRDGDAALQAFERRRNELKTVILDLDLPKRSGTACAGAIRNRDDHLPIIFVTGNVPEHVGDGLAGRAQILPKPFQMKQLVETVERVLRSVSGRWPMEDATAGSLDFPGVANGQRPPLQR